MRTRLIGIVAAALLLCAVPVWASADPSARSPAPHSATSPSTGKSTSQHKHAGAKRRSACVAAHKRHAKHKQRKQRKKHTKATQHKKHTMHKQDQQAGKHK